jgi:iron complex outermembrane receptor protein
MTRDLSVMARAGLMFGVSMSALMVSGTALAQDATQTPPATPAPEGTVQADQTVTEDATGEATDSTTIVVTGSRIRQPEFTSPDPVSLIDPTLARREGKLDIAQTLQSSPIAAGSTQITAAISSNFVTNGGPGAQTIDLRGLGANRTLVLLNGRRAGPAGTRGGVSSFDLNVLPQSIVSRVDVLKTGASSIYGSDAVAGVVNLITKTQMDGFQIDANASVPTDSGGEQFRISGMWGKKFDRGHVMLAVDFFKQRELKRGDRSWLGCPEARIYTDESHSTRADLVDPRTGKYHCEDLRWGHVWTYDLDYVFNGNPNNLFNTNGIYTGPVNLIQFQYPGETLGVPAIDPAGGLTMPAGWFPTGYDGPSTAIQNAYHPFVLEQTLIPKTERYTVYGDAAFELTDNIEAYAEFLGNRRKTYQNGWRQIWAFGYTGDPFGYGPGSGTYWAQGWSGYAWLSPTGITNHADTAQKVDYWRGVGGIRGDLGGFLKDWSYDAYVQYSHNKGIYKTEQFLQEIYDASSFQYGSCVGTTLPISGKQCMDLPWVDPNFLAGQFTPAQADYMFDWETGKTIYTQLSGEASITGSLFELPAGPVGVALGGTIRRDEIKDTPGEITLAGNAWGNTASGITAGYSLTKELFGEVNIPIFKDQPFFKTLSFSGAARLTNVKSVQKSPHVTDKDTGNWTYKLGGNWAVNDWLRFRATYGTSFRAPALFEQFKANETSFISARNIDPCVQIQANLQAGNISQLVFDRCNVELTALGVANPLAYTGGSITATVFSQGGIGVLDPETSKAKTLSVILTPTFAALPDTNMSLAIDYYDIKVNGQISQLGASNILTQCYESANYPNDPLCSLFTRGVAVDPAAIGQVFDKYVNIASQRNKGIDFTALVTQKIGGLGSINFLANVTRTLKQDFQLFRDQPADDLLGVIDINNSTNTGTRKWVGDFNLTWRAPSQWTFFWGVDWFSGADNEEEFASAHGGDLCTDSFNTFDDINGVPQNIPIRGHYCVDVSIPSTFYHNASITKGIGDKFEMTVGMSNIFDKRPPQVSRVGGTGIPALIGPVVGTSQYDFLGRRIFVNVSRKF